MEPPKSLILKESLHHVETAKAYIYNYYDDDLVMDKSIHFLKLAENEIKNLMDKEIKKETGAI